MTRLNLDIDVENDPGFLAGMQAYGPVSAVPQVTKTSSYNAGVADRAIVCNGAAVTITLPAPAGGNTGVVYVVKNINAADATVAPATGTIDGFASVPVQQWTTQWFVSTGATWYTLAGPKRWAALATKTGGYTFTLADRYIISNSTDAAIVLPTASAAYTGVVFTLKNIAATAAIVTPATGTVDGAANVSVAQYAKAHFISNGTTWYTV